MTGQPIDYQAELRNYRDAWVPEVGEKVLLRDKGPKRDTCGVGTTQSVDTTRNTMQPTAVVRWADGKTRTVFVSDLRHAFDYEMQEAGQ